MMQNIFILPTDKPSRLYKDDNQVLNLHTHPVLKGIFTIGIGSNQHIYITSNEDINENDYIITKYGRLIQVSYLLSKDLEDAFKVVLTTDQDLMADGLQSISDNFLEFIVNNPSCKYVDVLSYCEKLTYPNSSHNVCCQELKYKTIIQKEPKRETLEEVAKNYIENVMKFSFNSSETKIQANRMLKCVEFGANWQKEMSYSEEEVWSIINMVIVLRDGGKTHSEISDHFEQNKKK